VQVKQEKHMGKNDKSGLGGTKKTTAIHNKQKIPPKRRFSWSKGKIIVILAVVGLILFVLYFVSGGQQKPIEPLPVGAQTSGTPINDVDPMSGKPIVPGITSQYKGYTIGHCCNVSRGEWLALSDSQKDASLRRFLR
jgi:hypothetical protein